MCGTLVVPFGSTFGRAASTAQVDRASRARPGGPAPFESASELRLTPKGRWIESLRNDEEPRSHLSAGGIQLTDQIYGWIPIPIRLLGTLV